MAQIAIALRPVVCTEGAETGRLAFGHGLNDAGARGHWTDSILALGMR
jgi:hypothetical protein